MSERKKPWKRDCEGRSRRERRKSKLKFLSKHTSIVNYKEELLKASGKVT